MKREDVVRLIFELRQGGVHDTRVLDAFEDVRRDLFFRGAPEPGSAQLAEPLACGQVSEPAATLALLLEALDLRPFDRVLLAGAGNGYSVALAARLSGYVLGIERWRELARAANRLLGRVQAANTRVLHGDALAFKAAEIGRFDRILICGAVEAVPSALATHLAEGGRLVAPLTDEAEPPGVRAPCRLHWVDAQGGSGETGKSVSLAPLLPGLRG